MIDARKLHLVAELERLGTVAAVAEALHFTPSAVSMQLSAFERDLGVALTERRGRRLELTPAGRALAAHGRDIADRLALAEFEVDGLREGTVGHYRVAAFPTAARTIVADVWASLLESSATLTVSLTTPEPEDALRSLVVGATDLAVVHGYTNVPRQLPTGVGVTTIGTEPVHLAIRADDASNVERVDLAKFERRTWITAERDRTCFDMVERACGLAGYRPNVIAETNDFTAQLRLVQAGIGVALIPSLAIDTPPEGVAFVRPRQHLDRTLLAATRAEQRHDPGITTLTVALRTAMNARADPLPSM